MTIDETHRLIRFLIRKANGAWFSPEQIDDALNIGQLAVFNTYFEIKTKTQPIHMALNPFRVPLDFTPANFTNGVLIKPAGFLYIAGLMVRNYDNKYKKAFTEDVRIYKENQWEGAKKSQVNPATSVSPISMENETGFEFHPMGNYNGKLRYLRLPVAPYYAYTIVNRQPVNNAGASTNLEWADIYVNQIILKALSSIGINMSAQDILTYSEQKTNQSLNSTNKE